MTEKVLSLERRKGGRNKKTRRGKEAKLLQQDDGGGEVRWRGTIKNVTCNEKDFGVRTEFNRSPQKVKVPQKSHKLKR